jgi:hypothetical protein
VSDYTATSTANTLQWNVNGLIIDAAQGPKPEKASGKLLSTRAVETADGWLGQIIMAEVIVYQTKPQQTSEQALGKVNRRIHNRIKRLIVGP